MYVCVNIIYTLNLGSAIAVFIPKREQSCFKESDKKAKRNTKGIEREQKGVRGSRV